ncbi:hypothetical protein A2U01_0116582, partial [Trifolium medium]|nr:hypothetical protein [Trifolium medium]
QEKNSIWRGWAIAGEHLATCRQSSLDDRSRKGKFARARCKARPAKKHEHEG